MKMKRRFLQKGSEKRLKIVSWIIQIWILSCLREDKRIIMHPEIMFHIRKLSLQRNPRWLGYSVSNQELIHKNRVKLRSWRTSIFIATNWPYTTTNSHVQQLYQKMYVDRFIAHTIYTWTKGLRIIKDSISVSFLNPHEMVPLPSDEKFHLL